MSQEDYAWAIALAAIAWHQAASQSDQEGQSLALEQITAWAGQFRNLADQSANDPGMSFFRGVFFPIFVLVWLWAVSKYRAQLPKKRANRAGNFQIPDLAVLHPYTPQTLTQQAFQQIGVAFFDSPPCTKYPAAS